MSKVAPDVDAHSPSPILSSQKQRTLKAEQRQKKQRYNNPPPEISENLNWRWTDSKCSLAEWKNFKYRASANESVMGRIIPALPITCPSLTLKQPTRHCPPRVAHEPLKLTPSAIPTDILQYYKSRVGGHRDLRNGPGHSLEYRLAAGQIMEAGTLLIPVVGKVRAHFDVNLCDDHKSPFYIRLNELEVIDPTVVTHDIGYQPSGHDTWSTINYGARLTLRSQHNCPVCLEVLPTQTNLGSWFYETTMTLTNQEDHEVWYSVVLKSPNNPGNTSPPPAQHYIQIPNHRRKNIHEMSTHSAEQLPEGPVPRVKFLDTGNPLNQQLYGADHLLGHSSNGAIRIATFNCDGCFSVERILQADYLHERIHGCL